MKIVVTIKLEEEQKNKLETKAPLAEFVYIPRRYLKEEDLIDAEIILGNVNPSLLKAAGNLKWIQLNNAGTEGFWNTGILKKDVLLTNATGAYGTVIAEHILAMVLSLQKHLLTYYSFQREHEWREAGNPFVLEGSTVLILGFGDIGSTFAKKVKSLGCYVIGIKRRAAEIPDYVDELYGKV